MNITRENIDNLNVLLKVEVKKIDYEENVEKVLRDYRKKANIKGFRPGMVPIGIIRKMFGTSVKLEEINKLVSESLTGYLKEQNIEILGDPLPADNENENIDFEKQEDFEFKFEIGLAPEIKINLSKKNKIPFYEIIIDEKLRENYIDNYKRRYGRLVNVETSGDSDLLKGRVESAGDTGPESIYFSADDTTLATGIIKDEEIKRDFTGKKAGDSITFDIRKAFPNNHEIAGLLKTEKEQAEKVEGNYKFTISEIQRFEPAPVDKNLFDLVYGEDVVKTLEEFHAKIDEEIAANLANESNYKLAIDLKKYVLENIKFDLPEAFLRKWLIKTNKNLTDEQIEKEFESFLTGLRWQLIIKNVAHTNDIKITEEELIKEAEHITRYQFRQYGLLYATDEQISNFAREMLKREDEVRRIADRILEAKATEKLKEMITLDNKKVTSGEFDKLFE